MRLRRYETRRVTAVDGDGSSGIAPGMLLRIDYGPLWQRIAVAVNARRLLDWVAERELRRVFGDTRGRKRGRR